MRLPLLFLLGAVSACSQPFSAGLKAGVPLTDFINTVENVSSSVPNRYIIGVTGGAPFALRLRRRGRRPLSPPELHRSPADHGHDRYTTDQATANSWEFPVLLKYRFPSRIVRPYVDAGVALDTLSGLTDTVTQIAPTFSSSNTNTSKPASLANNTTIGFVMGAGVDVHALVVHISPEIRYTRWASPHFNLGGVISSNQNQAEFLVGITF